MSFLSKAVGGLGKTLAKPAKAVAKASPLGMVAGTVLKKKNPLPAQASPKAVAATSKPKPGLAQRMADTAKKKKGTLTGFSLR